jgi:hypothetical protein
VDWNASPPSSGILTHGVLRTPDTRGRQDRDDPAAGTRSVRLPATPALPSPARDLSALERLRARYGAGAADLKLLRLRRLARTELATPSQVLRLHEVLCFLRAYPDDVRVLLLTRRMLLGFARRPDLARHAASLADTGIAGTAIRYRFFWPTVRWLTTRWPARLRLDQADADSTARLTQALPLLLPAAAADWMRGTQLPAFDVLTRLCARRHQSAAACLVDLIERLPGDAFTREAFADAIDASYVLEPGADTPARARAHFAAAPFAFQSTALRRERPDLRLALRVAPRAVSILSTHEGAALLELARCTMVTRARDLMAFEYGTPREARLVDDGGGLSFAFCGVEAERRLLLPAIFGGLMLRNGVPIGYVQLDVLGPHAAVSFNVFETFRSGEAAFVFSRLLAGAHHVFGATSFSIEPYQLGKGNDEALESGAWWFYYKLGFRPRDARAVRLARAELRRIGARPGHRSSERTLRALAESHLFFDADPAQRRALPPLAPILARATARLAAAGGGRTGQRACEAAALRLTGLGSLAGFSRNERQMWQRWAPLLAAVPRMAHWPAAQRAAVIVLMRAKAGASEFEFLVRFMAHARWRRALFGRY